MFQSSWYFIVLLISALTSFVLALYSFQRLRAAGARYFSMLMFALAHWSLTGALEYGATTVPVKIFWGVMTYPGSQFAPAWLFLFVYHFTHPDQTLARWKKAIFFVIPCLSLLMAITNPWHGWLWSSITPIETDLVGMTLVYAHGPWFWIEILYSYSILAYSIFLLFRALFRFPHLFSRQNRNLLLASMVPWVLNIAYVFGSGDLRAVDMTPVAFTLASILLGWSIFRDGFLDFIPISREQILEHLLEGVLLADAKQRVLAVNPAFGELFHLSGEARGQPVARLLADWPEAYTFLTQGEKNIIEIYPASPPRRCYELKRKILRNQLGAPTGYLMRALDISERKQAEETLVARQRYLTALRDITHAALQASDLQTMLQVLADQIGSLLGADGGVITLWDEEHQITVSSTTGEPFRLDHPTDRSVTQTVLEAERALAVEDVANAPSMNANPAAQYPYHSLLALPLIVEKRKLGAVLIGYRQAHPFTPEEISLGEQAAAQIALAVLKSKLLYEAEQARQLAEAANQQLKQALAEMDKMAATDRLTGAYNRHRFDELIRYETSRMERYQQPLALLMFDIDHFKAINDTYGHSTGDAVLIDLVKTVNGHIRKTDTLFRWGRRGVFNPGPQH